MTSSMSGYRGPAGGNSGGMPSGGNKIPSGYKAGRLQQFTPEQMQVFQNQQQYFDPNSYLAKIAGGDEAAFAEMEAPAFRQFNQLQGDISSRFSGMGLGGRRGSGFQNAITQAGSDFAQDLQARRMELRRQALNDLMGYSNQFLSQQPYENFITKKQPSFWDTIMGSFGESIGSLPAEIIKSYVGGPNKSGGMK